MSTSKIYAPAARAATRVESSRTTPSQETTTLYAFYFFMGTLLLALITLLALPFIV